jgi:hypothetical protein
MAEIRTGVPVKMKRKGRKPLFDDKINHVAGKSDKYLHEFKKNTTEAIRHRAIMLGFSVQTFAAPEGGWNIRISQGQEKASDESKSE